MSTRLQTHAQPDLVPDLIRPRNSGLLQRRQTKAVDRRLESSDTSLGPKLGHDFSRVRIQPKLTVGEATSKYEKEADRVADRIMLSSDLVSVGPRSHALEPAANLQKQELSSGDREVTFVVESYIDRLKGTGHPLPVSTRAFFEPRFGHDFSQVRLHTDSRAADSARRLGARAFTVGTDIGFGAGF